MTDLEELLNDLRNLELKLFDPTVRSSKDALEKLLSPEFREIWARHEVLRPTDKIKVFRQSSVGVLRLTSTSLWTGPSQGPKLLTYTPVDAESRERLDTLHALALELAEV